MNEQARSLIFRFDAHSRCVLVTFSPQNGLAPIDDAWLRAVLAARGWSELHYCEDMAQELLARYQQGSPVTDLCLARAVDAQIRITLSADALEARLDLVRAEGGQPASEAQIIEILQQRGVQAGILADAIQAALAAGEACDVLIAQGKAASDGENGWLECLLPSARSRVPKIDASGHADYRDLGDILVVHAGETLMRRHPASKGVPGITLAGLLLPARDGSEVQFASKLEGATVSAENPDLLVAERDGQPVQVAGGMQVDPVFTVDSVNAATGHIRFAGSVVVRGDVQAGMSVRATGDIEVGGVVEAATLEAGGHIVIKGGVIGGLGRHDAHYLRCGGTFTAGYASQARIDAGDSIFIDDTAMQCELTAVNSVRLGGRKSGQLIGGRTQAMFSIQAKKIGSQQRAATRIEIGVNPLLHKELTELVKSREMRESQLFELSKIIDFSRKNPGKVHPEIVEKARKTAAVLTAEIKVIRESQTAMEENIELSRQSRVIAEQALYEGVEVLLGGQQYKVSGERGGCAIGFNEDGVLGLISLAELSGEAVIR